MNKRANPKVVFSQTENDQAAHYCFPHLMWGLMLAMLIPITDLMSQTTNWQTIITANPLSCNGDTNGAITFDVDSDAFPLSYAWSTLNNAFVFAQGEIPADGQSLTIGGNLAADSYLLRTEDAAGNFQLDTFILSQPPPIQVLDIAVDNSTCATNCDGYIEMVVGGGTGMLTTNWNDDSSIEGPSRNELCGGSYVFMISDENGCTQKGVLDIEEPAALEVEELLAIPTCLGANNGEISVMASGGVGEYSYNWSSGQQLPSLSDLPAGDYQLTLTDANNCNTTADFTLVDGPVLAPNVQINYGCGDGAILVSTQPVNGSPPYSYQWSTGIETPVLTAMSAGEYSLNMQDANGCASLTDFTIAYVEPLVVSATVVPVSCPLAEDGQISLTAEGGQPPFAVQWNNGDTGNSITGLPGGEYLFNLNANGCGFAQTVIVPEPAEITAELVFTSELDNSLTGTAIISGGTPSYQLDWSNGSTNSTVYNLIPETTYTLSVVDAHQCTASFEVIARLTDVDESLANLDLELFPNPTSGLVTVSWNFDKTNTVAYQLSSSNGQLVSKGLLSPATRQLIDMRNFSGGIYYLRLIADGKSVVSRIVKV